MNFSVLSWKVDISKHRNRNRKLLISRAPTKAKLHEPAYSQALKQNKIDRQGSRSRDGQMATLATLRDGQVATLGSSITDIINSIAKSMKHHFVT